MIDLNAIYAIASAINELGDKGEVDFHDIDESVVVGIEVPAPIHHGIDKEFYRATHDGNTEGFEHLDSPIEACISGVRFIITTKEQNEAVKEN